MIELTLGWPNGVLGLMSGTLAGVVLIAQAWRSSAWDIHEENSWYTEPSRVTVGVVAPGLILFSVLLTLLCGVAVLDRGLWPPFAVAADVLGLATLPLAVGLALKSAR